ncbi:MAG: putative methyltransferase YcgJ [Candidatus Heimdallarchaeota archaeon LC_3]|nr:MAG: putative methyltransferase YcgJ [Candidatus Heimdallarchaeota archaeon LC_3]
MFNFDWVVNIYDIIMPSRKPFELLKLMKTKSTEVVLEIGAGTGRVTKYYGNKVDNLVLLDPSIKMLSKAQEKLPHAKIIKGVAENLPFPDNSFTKIIGYDSLHHWQDQIKGLRESLRVLKKNGELFLIEVDPNNFWGNKVILFEKIIGMNSHFFSPPLLTKIVKKIGFSTVKFDPLSGGLAYLVICKK